MSYMAFHAGAQLSLTGKFWGTKIKDASGILKDTGVQEFVETFIQAITSIGPIQLDRPLEFINPTNGPAIKIYNTGDVDWQGIRLRDKAGNEAQFGIGLGNEGINANSFIPHPKYSIDPNDMHRFYSELGGNANTDREHPKAVEANNGLLGLEYLINNFQVPFWNWFAQPQFHFDDCHSYFTWNVFGANIVLPTFVPQSELILGKTSSQIEQDSSGTVIQYTGDQGAEAAVDPEVSYTAYNRFFLCIPADRFVLLACVDGDIEIIARVEEKLFDTATTLECINAGGSGQALASDGVTTVDVSSPFSMVPEGSLVAISRTSACGDWIIHAAECPNSPTCPVE